MGWSFQKLTVKYVEPIDIQKKLQSLVTLKKAKWMNYLLINNRVAIRSTILRF